MTKYLNVNGKENRNLVIPDDFVAVSREQHPRNGEQVTVVRYQKEGPVVLNNAHVTVIYGSDNRLISYNNFSFEEPGNLPRSQQAINLATQVFQSIDSAYAHQLSFMRIDQETRTFTNDAGQLVTTPILWVKFAHHNGSYNWVSIGPNNEIVEIERESRWDFGQWRRGTEEWNLDDWVLAREGKGPQLKAPSALA
ncbi:MULTISPECIES: hypothetical protein [Furfurilactobacillus]|uniref:Uncharacterized protein n=2 Tax=Furfurilactobacillus TaxID=2767882 RepID=A0A0R1RGI8_9LACO|nr:MULTISPECIES: hypothetical protein [Furfurilactobacillus]KRL55862.1 hypothetical protein FD35_GL002394 [Furfurilactobacillus rossiae DSM 15814]MCF6160920.1 hypothetical protein [Furfurilactobacillus milii]MCF6163314.1 hypothetical protein [Furfurilactobacillus milii]MCF6165101.1 hypothetical protein [Furfurilactobacillus rossiae]MDF9913969.1 hypothetical protein [Furfurilactobacillus milii]